MASLKEIKTRIASVKNTLKITSAMKLVASAKLHKAQTAIENLLPYSQRLDGIVSKLSLSLTLSQKEGAAGDQLLDFPLLGGIEREGTPRRIALVTISSSASLCGGFNNNLIRFTQQVIQEYKERGCTAITLIPIGRKVAQAFAAVTNDGQRADSDVSRFTLHASPDFVSIGEKPAYDEIAALSAYLTDLYQTGKVDRVDILYTHYKNMAVQTLMHKQFLPIEEEVDKGQTDKLIKTSTEPPLSAERDFLLEPSASELLTTLMPQALAMRLYATLLDSSAAEHAARTFAMQQATDNGEALLQELNLMYNKGRQQAITNELLDIVGGQMR